MAIRDQSEIQIRDLTQAVFRHKKKVALFILFTLASTAAILLLMPAEYDSEAKLYVRIGRESVNLDPTATTGQTVAVRSSRESEINSVVNILESRAICEHVVGRLGPDLVLGTTGEPGYWDRLRAGAGKYAAFLARTDEADEASRRDAAIRRLKDSIHVSVLPHSTMITVLCAASSPELAQQLVGALVEVTIEEHMRLNRTAGSEEFFAHQTELLRGQLADAEQRLRDLKNEKRIGSIDGQLDSLEAQKREIEAERLRQERELATATARHESLRDAATALEATILTQRVEGMANPAADGMRQQLFDLEIEAQELLEKYTDDHPFVPAIKQQLDAIRSIQLNEMNSRAQSTYAINPNWQEMQLGLLHEASRIASLMATDKTLQGQTAAITEKLNDLNVYAIRVADLEREADILEKTYKTYAQSLEQARIDAELKQERISNINVLQSASFENVPAAPNKKLFAGVGLLLALVGGLTVAMAAELCNRYLRTAAEVEEVLALPVLIAIPDFSSRHPNLFQSNGDPDDWILERTVPDPEHDVEPVQSPH